MRHFLAAVSVGIVGGVPMLDLDYSEDSQADADCNVVMTDAGWLVEVQATAERKPFSRDELLAGKHALQKRGSRRLAAGKEKHQRARLPGKNRPYGGCEGQARLFLANRAIALARNLTVKHSGMV